MTYQHNINFLSPLEFWKHKLTVSIHSIQEVQAFQTLYKAKTLEIDGQKVDSTIYQIVRIPNNFSLQKWHVIRYQSFISIVDNFDNFNYRKFMISRWIYFTTQAPVFEKLEFQESFLTRLDVLRISSVSILGTLYPQEEKIFLAGILLWAREEISKDLEEDFNNSGLTHILAVSGFNISILIVFLGFFFEKIPAPLRLVAMILGICSFVAFVWFWAPVVRAGIMGVLGYILLHIGRSPHTLSLILVTASMMVFWSPLSLNYDVSLHLSFLAVLWIYFTQWFFKKVFFFIPQVFAIQEAFVLTLSALVFTFPIMLFQFGQVSLLAPFANIAVTWMIPPAMFFGFLSVIFSFLFPFLAHIAAFFAFILLAYWIEVVRFFWGLDFALLKVDFWPYGLYAEILYFIVIIFLLGFLYKRNRV
jgi:competence protein ComEC